MRREHEIGDHGNPAAGEGQEDGNGLLTQMIQALLQGAEMPPKEVEGVSEQFCDGTCACDFLFLFCFDRYTVGEFI